MSHNLTDKQLAVLLWIVNQIRAGSLQEEFAFYWTYGGCAISGYTGKDEDLPEINRGILDALAEEGFIRCSPSFRTNKSGQTSESARSCVITKKALEVSGSSPASNTGLLARIRNFMPIVTVKILTWVAGIAAAVIAGLLIFYFTT